MSEKPNNGSSEIKWPPLKLTFDFERTESGLWFGHCEDLHGLHITDHSLEGALKAAAAAIPQLALTAFANDSKSDRQKDQFRTLYRFAESDQYDKREQNY